MLCNQQLYAIYEVYIAIVHVGFFQGVGNPRDFSYLSSPAQINNPTKN